MSVADTVNDPDEVRNLAGSAEHSEILARMGTVLSLWIQSTGDKGEIPEDDSIQPKFEAQMIEAYEDDYPVIEEREGPW